MVEKRLCCHELVGCSFGYDVQGETDKAFDCHYHILQKASYRRLLPKLILAVSIRQAPRHTGLPAGPPSIFPQPLRMRCAVFGKAMASRPAGEGDE
jgi:hypothetical protein